MSEALDRYCVDFSQLRRAPGPVFGELTRRRAPHKPLLLLSVIDLAAWGVLTSNFVGIEGDLTELNELVSNYGRTIVAPGQTSRIAFPFSRLHNRSGNLSRSGDGRSRRRRSMPWPPCCSCTGSRSARASTSRCSG